jgi:PhzF family phenazine biosynthesis protein
MQRPFKVVDVFTSVAFAGNPVAVVLDARGLSTEDMRRIAAWTNLSETTFVLPSERADYRARIFTPRSELKFAGHPTVGTAHAVREARLVPPEQRRLVMECQAGLVPLTVEDDGSLTAEVPVAKVTRELDQAASDELARALGGVSVERPLVIDTGPSWIVARVNAAATLAGLRPNQPAIAALSVRLPADGVTVYAAEAPAAVNVRSFAPADGIDEDPVCGSGNAAVAVHLSAIGQLDAVGRAYVARQGQAVGRDGRVRVRVDAGKIAIGGHSVTTVNGEIATA